MDRLMPTECFEVQVLIYRTILSNQPHNMNYIIIVPDVTYNYRVFSFNINITLKIGLILYKFIRLMF